jgi:hypothetical protein
MAIKYKVIDYIKLNCNFIIINYKKLINSNIFTYKIFKKICCIWMKRSVS